MTESDNPVEKEALLYTLGFLSSDLKGQYMMIEEILIKFAFSELTSDTGALRARASWVFGEYAS